MYNREGATNDMKALLVTNANGNRQCDQISNFYYSPQQLAENNVDHLYNAFREQ